MELLLQILLLLQVWKDPQSNCEGLGCQNENLRFENNFNIPTQHEPLSTKVKIQFYHRDIFVFTDAGGSDPDDLQSLVHLMHYADETNIMGLVGSYPRGKRSVIEEVLRNYKKDYLVLANLPDAGHYPTYKYLKSVTFQGATRRFKELLHTRERSAGVNYFIDTARQYSYDAPLVVLMWGSFTDLALALHDAPDIQNKVFAFVLGSWNRDQDKEAYEYLFRFKKLRWISSMRTQAGLHLYGEGRNRDSPLGNVGFVKRYVRPAGHLGRYYYRISANIDRNRYGIKMGDTPSFLWALTVPNLDPEKPSWGGRFEKVRPRFWQDITSPEYRIGSFPGAKTTAIYRTDVLRHWRKRLRHIKLSQLETDH